MDNIENDDIVDFLGQLNASCQKLNGLLKSDLDYFKKNQLNLLTENNKQKDQIMMRISDVMQKLTQACPEGLSKKIEQSSHEAKLHDLLSDLFTQIKVCNSTMNQNSDIVFLNLEILRDVWDRLASLNNINLYDKAGKIINYSSTL